jgi:DNA-binding transcriptional ArsR family regulator
MEKQLKEKIVEFNSTLDESLDLDDAVEQTLDYLLDNDIVDLSEDEDGDMYESLSNDVYDLLEEIR